MAAKRDDSLQSISVKLNGTNYAYWSYMMRNFLKGKRMWNYVISVLRKPVNDKNYNYVAILHAWESKWFKNFDLD